MRGKGSITLYLALSFLLILTLLLTLLESVRISGIKARSRAYTRMGLESIFGGYSREIWDKYRLLMLDGRFQGKQFSLATGESKLLENINLPLEERTGVSFYPMKAEEAEIISYTLMTDHEGKVFQKQVASSMAYFMTESAAKTVWNKLKKIDESQQKIDLNELMSRGEQSVVSLPEANTPKRSVKQMKSPLSPKNPETESSNPASVPYDPISSMRAVQGLSILPLLIQGQKISDFSMDLEQTLQKRSIRKGNGKIVPKMGWYETVLVQEYAIRKFTSYLDKPAGAAGTMSYQLEYLLSGSESDQKNLEITAGKILAAREVMNYLYLLSDEPRKGEAMMAALALSIAAGNPGAAETVQKAILAAWAFAESVTDVRTLMKGGKIPWKKNSADWKTSFLGMGAEAAGTSELMAGERGAGYRDYIRMLLLLQGNQKLAYRMMDLIELEYSVSGSRKIKMDEMIQEIKVSCSFQARALFLSLLQTTAQGPEQYKLKETEIFSY